MGSFIGFVCPPMAAKLCFQGAEVEWLALECPPPTQGALGLEMALWVGCARPRPTRDSAGLGLARRWRWDGVEVAMQSTYELVIVDHDDAGMTTVVPFSQNAVSIGRELGNAIQLTERNVSRHHARLVRSEDQVGIEDLGSYTGVQVNGQRIAGSATISEGDRVKIGDYTLALRRVAVSQRHHDGVVAQVADGRTAPAEEEPRAIVTGSKSGTTGGISERHLAPGFSHRQVLVGANARARALTVMVIVALLCGVYYRGTSAPEAKNRAAAPVNAPSDAIRRTEVLRSAAVPASPRSERMVVMVEVLPASPPGAITRRQKQLTRQHQRAARSDPPAAWRPSSQGALAPEPAAAMIEEAQRHYVNGDFAEAIRVARALNTGAGVTTTKAWRILGAAACKIEDFNLINEAYRHVDAVSRQYMLYVCQQSGVRLSAGQFVRTQ